MSTKKLKRDVLRLFTPQPLKALEIADHFKLSMSAVISLLKEMAKEGLIVKLQTPNTAITYGSTFDGYLFLWNGKWSYQPRRKEK